jgi:hypothetical protein
LTVEEDDRYAQVAKESGCSLHAGVAAQGLGARQAGKIVSLHITTRRIGKTPVADIGRQHPLPAQDALQ